MKKVLVIGGTGAMGTYLIPELLDKGYMVDVISMDKGISDNPFLTYTVADCKDEIVIKNILKNNYDAVVDFLIYYDMTDEEFKNRMELFLNNTKHYLYFSSYRVYANVDKVITEESPRLLEAETNKEFLDTYKIEYSLYKAIQEDFFKKSNYKNWSIIRPAITYSKRRLQLVTLEADCIVKRMHENKAVILPEGAMDVEATMSWAGDVAKMLSAILLNEKAYGETYTVATAEHRKWREIADYYKEIGGLRYYVVSNEDYLRVLSPDMFGGVVRQLYYDRMFDRIVDNSKILNLIGLTNDDLMPLKDGLKKEFDNFPKDYKWSENALELSERMDNYIKEKGLE